MKDSWSIEFDGYDPDLVKVREAVFCQSNGYLGVRGYPVEGPPGFDRIPGTYGDSGISLSQQYAAPIFDVSPVTGYTMVNLPTWRLAYIHLNGEKVDLSSGRVADYRRRLDMKSAVAERSFVWTSPDGCETRLTFTSFLPWNHRHVSVTRIGIEALNWSGPFRVSPTLDGAAATLRHHHLEMVSAGECDQGLEMEVRTLTTDFLVAQCRRLVGSGVTTGTVKKGDLFVCRDFGGHLDGENPVALDDICAVCSSADHPDGEDAAGRAAACLEDACGAGFEALLQEQREVWSERWRTADVEVDCDDPQVQARLRYYIFQLLQSYRGDDPRLSIGAKMLSGQHYAGHSFWDTDIFLLPFYAFVQPGLARSLCGYRTQNLGGALKKAHDMGFKGAFYPWEGDPLSGGENCPKWWTDEESEKEVRILCGELELHINAAVVYGLDHFRRVTGDVRFWQEHAVPVVIECARFWASRGEWEDDVFVIRDVIGPDEYHERVDNDCYTNHIARWTLRMAASAAGSAGVPRDEQSEWLRIADGIKDQYLESEDLLAQDDTFLSLPVDIESGVSSGERLYVKYTPDELSKMPFVKQASVIALFHLFPYDYDPQLKRNCWDFYVPRTVHDSNLSAGSHAYVAATLGLEDEALRFFNMVLATDLCDVKGNTAEGIHAANAGSAWAVTVMGFGGVYAGEEALYIDPRFPRSWTRLAFTIFYRSRRLDIEISPGRVEVRAGAGPSIDLVISGDRLTLDDAKCKVGKEWA